jgi:hypothetical protein
MNTTNGRLDKETHTRIFVEEILPESKIHSTTPQTKPSAIIVAGQPGAGKRGLVEAAKLEFHSNVVTIDPDEKRDYYPDVEKLRETHPYTWSELTNGDAGAGLARNAIQPLKALGISLSTPRWVMPRAQID